jgi:hypothetical protein
MSLGLADGGSLGFERGNVPRTPGNSEWRQQQRRRTSATAAALHSELGNCFGL